MFARLFADASFTAHVERLSAVYPWDTMAVARDPRLCFENRHAQPLVCLYALIVGAALGEQRIEPELVAGYSVGELAAYGVAGALSSEEVIAAATARAQAMDDWRAELRNAGSEGRAPGRARSACSGKRCARRDP